MTKRLFLALAGLAVVVLILADVVGRDQVVVAERRGAVIDLERQAFKIALNAQDDLERDPMRDDPAQIRRLADRAGARLGGVVVVADRHGRPVASSPSADDAVARSLARHEAKPAVRHAATSSRTVRVRGTDYEVAEVPIVANQGIVGVVLLAQRSSVLDEAASDRLAFLTPALVIAIVLSVGLALLLARALTRPLGQLVAATRRVARQGSGAPSVEPRGPAEVRELADAFNAMSLRVRDLIDRQSQFASDVSHQLRTPLTVLGVAVERTRDRGAAGDIPGAGESLAAVHAEVARMRQLVEGLLVLTKVPLGDAVREPVDLATIAHDRAEMWRELAREHGVEVMVHTPQRAEALAVVGAVDQILDNLIDNAVDVAPRGSAIEIDVATVGPVAAVSVRDRGPGMSEVDRARAFDRFWRADATAGDGIGIGLTIVRDLTEACGGEIELLPADGGGTRAVLTLETVPGRVPDPGEAPGLAGAPAMAARLRSRLGRYLRARDPDRADAVETAVWLACTEDGAEIDGCDECATTVFAMAHARMPEPPDSLGPELDAHLLRTLGGLDTGQIAQVLEVTPRTVERLERRARGGLMPVVDGRLVPTPVSRPRISKAARVGVIAAAALVAAGGTAAATGSLPDPVQHEVARVLRSVGVHVPDPEPDQPLGASDGDAGRVTTGAAVPTTGPSATTAPAVTDDDPPATDARAAAPDTAAPADADAPAPGTGSGRSTAPGQVKRTDPTAASPASAFVPPGQAKQSGSAFVPPGQAKQSGSAAVPPGQAKQSGSTAVPPGQARKATTGTSLPPGQSKKAAAADGSPAATLPPGQAKKAG